VDPLAVAFGTALVAAMATDTWQQAHAAVAALWRKARSSRRAKAVAVDLKAMKGLRGQVVSARQASRVDAERALAETWQGRLQELLADDPGLAGEVRRVLDETLTPMLAPAERTRVGQIIMTGSSHDASTFNQVAGDQFNVRP
jgi:hypothetical protein